MATNDDLFESFNHGNKKLYIMQKWSQSDERDYLTVVVSDATNFWAASYSKSQLRESSNTIDFDLDGVKSQMIQAFRNQSRADFEVSFKLKSDFLESTLSIKKILERDCKVEVVGLKLKIVEDTTFKTQEMFDYCIHRIRSLESNLEGLRSQIKLFDAEKTDALKALDECVKQKEDIEFDLFSKFVHILNAKKQKIRELVNENID